METERKLEFTVWPQASDERERLKPDQPPEEGKPAIEFSGAPGIPVGLP